MLKFRSMIEGADRSGVSSTSSKDNRITKVGHYIRRYKLDETVQLWNVLRGDMSLVGPPNGDHAGAVINGMAAASDALTRNFLYLTAALDNPALTCSPGRAITPTGIFSIIQVH